MRQFTFTITDPLGIHARPAGLLVKAAGAFKSTIALTRGEKTADVKRLFALMGLGTRQGDTVVLTVHGPDEDEALETLSKLLQESF